MKEKTSSKDAWLTAYEAIRQQILSMEMKPGEIVSENNLSKQLGISRTPIREALKKLELDGLIISANRRKRVFILTIHEIEEIFDLKIAIEGSIAGWAAERAEKKERDELRQIVQKMEHFADIVPDQNYEVEAWVDDWLKVDNRYHDLLFLMARNKRAEQIIKNLNDQWHRLRIGILAMEGRIQKSVKEHHAIARAILDGNASEAEQAMQEHLRNLKKMITTIMSAFHFPM